MPTQIRTPIDAGLRLPVIVLAAALVAAAAAFPAADAGAATACRPAGSKVLASNAKVVVYRKRRAYGCHRRSGRTVLLEPMRAVEHYYTAGRFRLAGSRVAYVITSHYYTGSQSSYDSRRQKIAVRDLAGDDAVRYAAGTDRALAAWSRRPPDGVRDLELTSRGTVAWIIRDPEAEPKTLHVYVADAQGRREVDAGDGIAETSLRIAGDTVTWLHDGQPRSAPLT